MGHAFTVITVQVIRWCRGSILTTISFGAPHWEEAASSVWPCSPPAGLYSSAPVQRLLASGHSLGPVRQ